MATAELGAAVWRLRNIGGPGGKGPRPPCAQKSNRVIQLHHRIGDRIAHCLSSEAPLLLLIVGPMNVFRCGKAAGDTRISLIIPCYPCSALACLARDSIKYLEYKWNFGKFSPMGGEKNQIPCYLRFNRAYGGPAWLRQSGPAATDRAPAPARPIQACRSAGPADTCSRNYRRAGNRPRG